jgi:hypothetical protein
MKGGVGESEGDRCGEGSTSAALGVRRNPKKPEG